MSPHELSDPHAASARTTRRWPAFLVLSTLLHGVVLASLSWIPIARGAASVEADEPADDGYVIQLRLRPASAQASAEAVSEVDTATASDAQVAPEPPTAPPPPELASAPPPEPAPAPAFEIEPEPSPEPTPRVEAPVVTTTAEEAPALAQGPTPPAPEAPAPSAPRSEEKPAVPASSAPAEVPANSNAQPTQTPAPAASAPKPATTPGSGTGASKDAANAGLGALDDGFHLRALRSDRPEYPEDARRRSEEGTVTCRLTIDRDGRVVEVQVLASSGSAALDRAAVRALKRWRFESLARITDRERVHAVQKLTFELKSARP